MKKRSAFLFLMVMLFTQTPAQQLLKLPILVEHYREHLKEDPNISFTAFIRLHYFSGNPKDADYDRDQQLPFRECDVVMTTIAVDLPQTITTLEAVPYTARGSWPLFDINFYSSNHRHDVWQPPKSC